MGARIKRIAIFPLFLTLLIFSGCEEERIRAAKEEFNELLDAGQYDQAFNLIEENQYLGDNQKEQVIRIVFQRRLDLIASSTPIKLEEAEVLSMRLEESIRAEILNQHPLIKEKFDKLLSQGKTSEAEKVLAYFSDTLRAEPKQKMAETLYNLLMAQTHYDQAAAVAQKYELTGNQTTQAAKEGFEKIQDPVKRLEIAQQFDLSDERQTKAAASFCSYIEEKPEIHLSEGKMYLEIALEYDVAKETRMAMAGWVIILMLEQGAIKDAAKIVQSFNFDYNELKPIILAYNQDITPFHFLQFELAVKNTPPPRLR